MPIKRSLASFVALLFGGAFLPHARSKGFMLMFSPEPAGGGGGDPKPKGTVEQQLAAALSANTTLEGQVTSLTTERDTLKSEVGTIKGQFEAVTKTANEQKEKITGLETQVTTLTGQLTQANEKATKATENVTRLETLCGVKGISTSAAVPAIETPENGGPAGHVYDQWANAAGSEKTRLWRAHKKEIRAEGMRRVNNPRG